MRVGAWTAALVAALAFAGCGGGATDDSAAARRTFKARGSGFSTKTVICESVPGGFRCQKRDSPDARFELTDEDFSLNRSG